jgi:hypothetical protein
MKHTSMPLTRILPMPFSLSLLANQLSLYTLNLNQSILMVTAGPWKARLPKKDKEIADAWCSILATAM